MRLHLAEIEDQPWCPAIVRRFAMDHLRTVFEIVRPYRRVSPLLRSATEESGASRIVDLCSGSGGPWETLDTPLPVLLTDKFPSRVHGAPRGTSYAPDPVDAREVPAVMDGFLTMFTAFHHFAPHDARTVLEQAARRAEGIAVFEATERSTRALVLALLAALSIFVLAPFTRPFDIRRLLLVYVAPLIPIVVVFDGVVSVLRSYTTRELLQLCEGLHDNCTWRAGRLEAAGLDPAITYLIGVRHGAPERLAG